MVTQWATKLFATRGRVSRQLNLNVMTQKQLNTHTAQNTTKRHVLDHELQKIEHNTLLLENLQAKNPLPYAILRSLK